MRNWGPAESSWRRSGGWVIAWWTRATKGESSGGDAQLRAAIHDLRKELEGGPRAHLGREVRDLADLLARREQRRGALERDPLEHELLAAMPDAAALVSREGWVRVSNASFDALAVTGRSLGLTPLEITRSVELSNAVKRALEGTTRALDLTIGRNVYRAHLAPLLRGEVLVILRDVTDARRAESARRDFIANASHELKTPIAAIHGAAETLSSGAVNDPATARSFLEIIERHSRRMSRLVDDMLDLSRIETRQWKLELGPVDATAVARQVIELLGAAARAKGLALASELPEGVVVRADPRAIEQVLVNLVDNAVKYTARGAVTLQAEKDGNSWILTVLDTGVGIEAHHLPRLFERFYRVDPGRSREQGGTGLGLAIVKHLVQAMSGEVGVESGPDGSRFWIRLAAA